MFENNIELPAVFKSSGWINGRASIFVVPVEMPVTMDVVPVTMDTRVSGWVSVAMTMAADVNENPAVAIGTEPMPRARLIFILTMARRWETPMPMRIRISAGRPGFHNRRLSRYPLQTGTGVSEEEPAADRAAGFPQKEEVGDAEINDI